jgi:hypothetical protein
MYALHFYTIAYVELIGWHSYEKTYLQTYIVKSNNGSKESWVIKSNQDVQVYGMRWIFMVANPNSTMLLEIFSLELGNKCKKTWAIFYSFLFSSFFRRASKYPLFWYFRHLSIFFYSFFCIATCFFYLKYLRDNTKELEHLFKGNLNGMFLVFPSSVGEFFFWWNKMKWWMRCV